MKCGAFILLSIYFGRASVTAIELVPEVAHDP
jgi:hypothetical protein